MIIDGKLIAAQRLEDLRLKIQGLQIRPKLVAVLVGNDPASETYVKMKAKRAQEIGIGFEVVRDEKLISKLNQDKSVTGIIVQLPLPANLDSEKILQTIDPKKDVDGLTGKSQFLPATVKAVLIAIEKGFGRSLDFFQSLGMTVVVVGQGKLVGKPLADYLEKQGVNVIRCDINTRDLSVVTRHSDVLVVATGVSNLIKAEMVKPGAIVIDCGAPKAEVDSEAYKIAGSYTPVPGGIGPLTVASLLENTVEAARMAD